MSSCTFSSWVRKMSQKNLVVSLHKEGLTAKTIRERLVEIFGQLPMPYSTVTRIFRETCWTPFEQASKNFGGRVPNREHDAWILCVLERSPNVSVREISDEARIPKSTVFDILRGRLHSSWRIHSRTWRADKDSRWLLSLLQSAERS
jgi:hypothetical protein